MELTAKQIEYIKRNYDKWGQKKIFEAIKYDDFLWAPEHALELFDYYEELPSENNPYFNFTKYLEEENLLSKRIIEVAAGRLARVGQKIANYQAKTKEGTITVYDNLLDQSLKTENALILKHENFSRKISLDDTDLIIALKPCTATEEIIISACKAKKDFVIALCNCDHSPSFTFDGYYDLEEYYRYLRHFAHEQITANDNGQLFESQLPGTYNYEAPILQNIKVKRR